MAVEENRSNERSDNRSLHLLQVLRGVAALMVVVHHATAIPEEQLGAHHSMWMNGAAGVDIFFVISGFVMALSSRSLRGRAAPPVEFMKRRLERIVPLYWIFTTLKVLLLIAVPAMAVHSLGTSWHVAASYLFLPCLKRWGGSLPVLPVGWTLNFEMLFYALFATALWLRVKPLKMLAPVLLVFAIVFLFVHDHSGAFVWFDPIVLEFLFGMLLHEAYTAGKLLGAGSAWFAAVAGFSVICFTTPDQSSMARPWTWGLAAMAIVGAGLSLEQRLGRKAPAWLLEIGDASYSIYLTHAFVVPLIGVALKRMPYDGLQQLPIVIALCLFFSLLAGIGTYRLVEKPIIDWFRQRRERKPPAEASA